MNRLFAALFLTVLCLIAQPGASFADSNSDLIYRVSIGNARDVSYLLKNGASPDAVNEKGIPALALAATRRGAEAAPIITALLDAGANINATDSGGQTALFYAAKNNLGGNAKLLLERGINYYAADNNGNIARSAAHYAGHDDMVKLLDDFIIQQGDNVRKEYENYSKQLQQRYQEQLDEAMKKAQAEQAAQADAGDEEVEEPALEEKKEEPKAEPEKPKPKPKKKERTGWPPAVASDGWNLSYHNCAMQYWSFCKDAGQTTELSEDELEAALETHKDKIYTLSQHMLDQLGQPRVLVDRVSLRGKSAIYDDLSKMPSNTFRREKGVGRMDDMKKRCSSIARYWDAQYPPPEPVKKKPAQKKRYGKYPAPRR